MPVVVLYVQEESSEKDKWSLLVKVNSMMKGTNMPYIAHAGVQLYEYYTAYEKNHWYFIKNFEGYNFHWRINDENIYEVVCELFADKRLALFAAKSIYVTMLYNLLYKGIKITNPGCESYAKSLTPNDNNEPYPDNTFYWTPKCIGGGIGPDVYEVPESFEEYDQLYKKVFWDLPFSVSTTAPALGFDNYEKFFFTYNETTQPLLNTIVQADSVSEIGLQMTLYCGLLEHLSDDKQKDPDVISEIDLLVNHVDSSSLADESKNSLIAFLKSGKTISARQKCKFLCQQYAKEKYGPYTTKQVLDDAYSIRSAFSHGEDCHNRYSGPAPYIKLIVLDVLYEYMKDHN